MFSFTTSCSLFKTTRMDSTPEKAKQRICLNSEGKGRFLFKGQKHIFSYQSHFSEEDQSWKTLIDFPAYGRESIELDWDNAAGKASYKASYEQALLRNTKDLDPALVEGATQMWIEFFEDMLITRGLLQKDSGEKILWTVTPKSLEGDLSANGKPGRITFLNPVGAGYFGRFDFKLYSEGTDEAFGMELIVRNCLEKAE